MKLIGAGSDTFLQVKIGISLFYSKHLSSKNGME